MPLDVKHSFFAPRPQSVNPNIVSKNAWEASHAITGILGTDQGGTSVSVASFAALVALIGLTLGLPTVTTVGRLARFTNTTGAIGQTSALQEDASGNVGIAVTPVAKFAVDGGAGDGIVNIGQLGGTSDLSGIDFSVLTSRHPANATYNLLGGDGHTYLNAATGFAIRARINNVDQGQWNATGLGVGIAPASKLHVSSPNTYNGTVQVLFADSVTATKRFELGYDGTNNIGYLQSSNNGVAFTPLVLNARGGNVGIGHIAPGAALDILGGDEDTIRLGNTGDAADRYRIGRDTATGFLHFKGTQTILSGYRWLIDTSIIAAAIENNGRVSIGAIEPALAKLDINGGSVQAVNEGGGVLIRGSTSAMRLPLGVDNAGTMFAWIQPVQSGVAYRNLALNQLGGNVGVGDVATVGAQKMQVISSGQAFYAGDLNYGWTMQSATSIAFLFAVNQAFNLYRNAVIDTLTLRFAISGSGNPLYIGGATNVSFGTQTANTISGLGFKEVSFSGGTISSGTYTPDAANGNKQHITNNGAFTLAPPAASSTIELEITNGASAGAITTSGFTKVTGDAFTTTNTHKFVCYVTKTQTYTLLTVVSLQ